MTWFRQQKPWEIAGKFEVWVKSLGYGFVKQFVQWRSQATPVWIIRSSQAQWLLDTADSIQRSFGGLGCENRRLVPQLWQVSWENAGRPPNLEGFPIISEQSTGAPRRPAGSCHCLSEKTGPRYGSQKWGIDANKIPLRLRTTMLSVANRSFFHIILKSRCFMYKSAKNPYGLSSFLKIWVPISSQNILLAIPAESPVNLHRTKHKKGPCRRWIQGSLPEMSSVSS